MFHVSLLKKSISSTVASQPLASFLAKDWELKVEPAEVLDHHLNSAGAREVLIKWQHLPDFENSWEDMSALQNQFPEFHLEDKVNSLGGSVDKTPKVT